MALSFACVDKSRIGAFRIISMSLANRLVSFVSQHTVDGPDAGPPRVLLEISSHQTIIALAATGYGLAIVPSTPQIPADRGGAANQPRFHD
jgi:DNA-binding transcriptional LysR family regulator